MTFEVIHLELLCHVLKLVEHFVGRWQWTSEVGTGNKAMQSIHVSDEESAAIIIAC